MSLLLTATLRLIFLKLVAVMMMLSALSTFSLTRKISTRPFNNFLFMTSSVLINNSALLMSLSTSRDANLCSKRLSQLNTAYDFCVIDNPPVLNVAVANSRVASNKIIISSSAEAFALDGLMELFATLDDVHQFMNQTLIVDGILITIFNPRTIIGQHMKEQLSLIAQVINIKIYNTVIRRCNSISVSQSDRKNIFDFPTTKAAIDYGNFIDEFLGGNIYG